MLKICVRLLVMFCCVSVAAQAQDKIQGISKVNAGIVSGEEKTNAQFHFVQGVQYHSWYGGVGVGLDYYRFRTVPIYVALERRFPFHQRYLFVGSDVGVNSPWIEKKKELYTDDKFKTGLFFDAGAGVDFTPPGKREGFRLFAAYEIKELSDRQSQYTLCLIAPCPLTYQIIRYHLHLFSLRLGYAF